MKRAHVLILAPVIVITIAAHAFAQSGESRPNLSAEIDSAIAEFERSHGKPFETDGPACDEARRSVETWSQVPGFDDRVNRVRDAVPECFEGWEPGSE